jgi:hypothetical protein
VSNWFFVETYHNWKQDFDNKFEYLGIHTNKYNKKKPRKNDYLITYISKSKKISDIRQIIDNNVYDTPKTFSYDKNYAKCIKTKLIKCLSEDKWISYSTFANSLEVFRNKKHPGFVLLNAPIRLSDNEYNYLYDLINKE